MICYDVGNSVAISKVLYFVIYDWVRLIFLAKHVTVSYFLLLLS